LGERFDPFDELLASFDIDAGVAIGQPRHAAEARRLVDAGQRAALR
jgi:hypothetical protein